MQYGIEVVEVFMPKLFQLEVQPVQAKQNRINCSDLFSMPIFGLLDLEFEKTFKIKVVHNLNIFSTRLELSNLDIV